MLVFFANKSHTGHLAPCSGMSKKTHSVIKFTIFHSNTFFIPHFIIWLSRVRFPVPIKAPSLFPGVKITPGKNFISWNQRWPLVKIFWESPISNRFFIFDWIKNPRGWKSRIWDPKKSRKYPWSRWGKGIFEAKKSPENYGIFIPEIGDFRKCGDF